MWASTMPLLSEVADMRRLVDQYSVVKRPSFGVVDPRNSPYLGIWDLTTALALIFTALVTPFEVAFVVGINVPLFVVNRMVDLIFAADIVLQFFLAIPISGKGGGIVSTLQPEPRNQHGSLLFPSAPLLSLGLRSSPAAASFGRSTVRRSSEPTSVAGLRSTPSRRRCPPLTS